LRVDLPDRRTGFFDNMTDRRITGTEWDVYEIVGDVAEDAVGLSLGLLMTGPGRAWIDAVSFAVVGDAAPVLIDAPRPLAGRELENMVAFVRLLGYVRYFHPSDGSAATEWEEFAIRGVRQVEDARDAGQLAAVLDELFRPIAPTLVVRAGSADEVGRAGANLPASEGSDLVMWRHTGVGTGQPGSIYRSERARTPIQSELAADSFPDPRQPFVAELGGGVSAAIPLVVFADAAGTLPAVTSGEAASEIPALTRTNFTADDRATRLAAVALAWNVFQHFYPYFDVTEVDWSAELAPALRAAAMDADEREFLTTLRALVAALEDGHGYVNHASALQTQFLPLLWDWIEDRAVITAVADGTVGIHPGDAVLRINDRPVAELLAEEESLTSSATPQWRLFRALGSLLADSVAGEVVLELANPRGERRTVTVPRGRRTAPVVEARPEPIAEVRPGIWYVDLDRVTTEQFRAAILSLKEAQGLIFDLRGYPRQVNAPEVLMHLIESPATSARWLVPIVTRPDGADVNFKRSEWNLLPRAPHLGAPRVFITDGRAISYAESVMGIVEHYRLAEIVGAATAGTNGNVNPFRLPGGYHISWTGMKVLKHDGSRHHGVGIQPTIPVSRTVAGVAAGRDELLERAIAAVQDSR
jgi:C-terminal processing protease CtpA/Prc